MTSAQDFSVPFHVSDFGEAEEAAAVECLRSGWLTTGPRCQALETFFAEQFQVHAVAVDSATNGCLIVLDALGIGAGDEIIFPSMTFSGPPMIASHLGAKVVWCDVDRESLNATWATIAPHVTDRTKAIVVTHFAGRPADVGSIVRSARQHSIHVIEDAAHAYGAASNGCKVGGPHSDAVIFSFYPTKPIASAGGGMITTPHAALAKSCRIMRLLGIDRTVWQRQNPTAPSWQYDVVRSGYKANMTDLEAAIAVVQCNRAEEMHSKRRAVARRYIDGLADLSGVELPSEGPSETHSWHLFTVRVPAKRRDYFIRLMQECGVACSVHFIPVHLMSHWRRLSKVPISLPLVEAEWQRLVSLPIYPGLSDAQIDKVVGTVRDAADQTI